MNKTALYYKLKIEIEQKLNRKLTEDEKSVIDLMAKKTENGSGEKCK